MRARMALAISKIPYRLREVILRDKPNELIEASSKATVPVLVLTNGQVIDESIAIMDWALNQADPQDWRGSKELSAQMHTMIEATQAQFKGHLDRYKYPNRYEDSDPLLHRARAVEFLQELCKPLSDHDYLMGPRPMLADFAIFPFIRQFANTDREWFDHEPSLNHCRNWLEECMEMNIFADIMEKYPQWTSGDQEPIMGG